jgi:hypothetical protein
MPKYQQPYRLITGPNGRLARRQPFDGHTMEAHTGPAVFAGELNATERARFEADRDRTIYTVFSYVTPIAWVLDDGTIYHVQQKWGATTSKHQSYAKAWLK